MWKQTAVPSYNESTGIVSGLTFSNFDKGRNLNFNNSTSFSFDGKQLYSSNGFYLNFDTTNGFTISEDESDFDIIIYSIGTGGAAAGGVEEDTQYSYYSYGLNTNMLEIGNQVLDSKIISTEKRVVKTEFSNQKDSPNSLQASNAVKNIAYATKSTPKTLPTAIKTIFTGLL